MPARFPSSVESSTGSSCWARSHHGPEGTVSLPDVSRLLLVAWLDVRQAGTTLWVNESAMAAPLLSSSSETTKREACRFDAPTRFAPIKLTGAGVMMWRPALGDLPYRSPSSQVCSRVDTDEEQGPGGPFSPR